MIEVLVTVVLFLIEVVGQSLVSIPFDCSRRSRERQGEETFWFGLLFLVMGGMMGWVLAGLIPPLVHAPALRIASLVISPILAGVIGFKIATWQSENRNPLIVPRQHFWYTFLFTLGLVCVRFVYAK